MIMDDLKLFVQRAAVVLLAILFIAQVVGIIWLLSDFEIGIYKIVFIGFCAQRLLRMI